MTDPINRFKEIFNRLDGGNLHLLEQIYESDVVFRDPVHELAGLDALRAYYARLYDGVLSCRFEFEDEIAAGNSAVLVWVMHFEHARFCRGEKLTLRGVSHLRFNDKVSYHHDYFDMGAFIYEKVPILGSVIRAIKSRL